MTFTSLSDSAKISMQRVKIKCPDSSSIEAKDSVDLERCDCRLDCGEGAI